MRLFIINGENNDEKKEIQIKEDLTVEDIKFKLIEIPHENRKFTTACYRFIHKNIILFEYVSIKYYKVCENDTLWFGDISNYLRKNDVIIYVFYVSTICDMNCLIVKKSDKISKIRSMIERIQGQIITIWNADGEKMKDDQIVTEIDKNENYKLIIRCDDTEGNKINYTFDQYCCSHDEGIVDMYLYVDKIRDDNKNESTRPILINGVNRIRQIVQFSLNNDDRLNKKLSDFPPSLLNSINLFCNYLSNHILYISFDYWRFVINQYNHDFPEIFNMIYSQYFQFAIDAATWDFSNNRQRNNKTNKLVGEILIDSLIYILKYLSDSSNDWQYWLRLWMKSYLLKPFSDFRLNASIAKCKTNKFTIKMRMNEKDRNNFISFKPKTILEAKKSLSAMHNIDMKSLYCIKPGGDHKLNDEDKFDDEFKIEMTLSMDNIEILKLLGQGAFGATYLCLDKISNKQFVLKKAIRSDGDLYRDISNYSKLASSLYIINYSGLFRDEEKICIGMEYMSGGSLRSYLSERKYLSEQELVRISYEILTQINDSHKLGIIHRDIKSDNIVLDEHNHAKLIDFGISKDTTGLTSKDLSDKLQAYKPGTFYYMAPELVKEEPYSEKIDIWSFGMVMVEMVTGKIPFPALKPFQVILKLRNLTKYEFEPNFSISNELKHFINSSLITNPNERPSAEQLIMSELFIDYLKKV